MRRKLPLYVSTKSGKVYKARSGWEISYMLRLDTDVDVVKWDYESIKIPYVSNKRTGKLRNYYPDFVVESSSKGTLVVEIKPLKRVGNAVVVKKSLAAIEWCNRNNMTFLILTEIELKALRVI